MNQTSVPLGSIDEQNPVSQQQQHEISIPIASQLQLNLPRADLLVGSREDYINIGVPLYEASIKGDWKTAEVILGKKRELVRFSITENCETALHIAASAKSTKQVEEFVENLVNLMETKDLELQNNNSNTALCLAAAAGNVKMAKIMVEKNRALLIIAGSQKMMPLYMAALFGNSDMVKYLYNNANGLRDDGWTRQNRGWLLLKCVESDLFDVALQIVKDRPELATEGSVLGILARKPDAFTGIKPNIIRRIINSIFAVTRLKVGPTEKESEALQLLRIIWKNIAKKSKYEIDDIIRGPPDPIKQDNKPTSEKEDQKLQLLKLIAENIVKNQNIPAATSSKDAKATVSEAKATASDIGKMPVENQNISAATPSKDVKEMASEAKATASDIAKMPVENQNIPAATSSKDAKATVLEARAMASDIGKMPVENMNIPAGTSSKDAKEMLSEAKATALDIGKTPVENQNIPAATSSKDAKEMVLEARATASNIGKMPVENQNIPAATSSKDATATVSEAKATASESAKQKYSSRILFVAAEMGNTKFIVELIRQYPDLIWKVNDSNQSIFHIAVKHRHEGIYNLLYEIGSMKDLITPLKDENGNNMLHLVGKIAKKKRLQDVSGVALQMQRELLWFKEVEAMIPPSYRERKNKDGLTPHELFTKEHKDLVSLGEKWMKGTASQCMVVAALIATIVFAAAFTVPGGYNQTYGFPIFYRKETFMVFVVTDAISLFSSSASILMFLSILTSRYAERDFLESLPKKLMLGLATLFLSITTMMVAFSVSFFVLYHNNLKWIPILISLFAAMPVLLFATLQYPLLVDVIHSTYGSRYLFKPEKLMLY